MGSSEKLSPGILGHARWCLLASGFAWALAQPPFICAQSEPENQQLETQQKANERIREISARVHTPPHDYVIGRGDVLSVEVFDVPELSRDLRVSQTGTVGIPLVPVRLYMVGLTEIQAQQKIAEVLEANGLVSHPQVMVFVKEKRSKPITIVGAVARPMVYQADHPVTLVEVLAEAGGIAADAGDTVIVTRRDLPDQASTVEPPEIGPEEPVPAANPSAAATTSGQPLQTGAAGSNAPAAGVKATAPVAVAPDQTTKQDQAANPPPVAEALPPPVNTITVNLAELLERGDMDNNIALQAGDVITVPHAGIVYALGAVQRPGGFVATNDRAQLSTLKVLALAGGTTRIAKKDHAVIIRKDSSGKQQEIPVDLSKIIARQSEDVRLFPSDILYVPDSSARAALIRTGEIALAVGTAIAIYRVGR